MSYFELTLRENRKLWVDSLKNMGCYDMEADKVKKLAKIEKAKRQELRERDRQRKVEQKQKLEFQRQLESNDDDFILDELSLMQ